MNAEHPQPTMPETPERSGPGARDEPEARPGAAADWEDEDDVSLAGPCYCGSVPPAGAGVVIVDLATLPPGATVDETALARILGRSKRTLQVAVTRGDLPPGFLFLGRRTWTAGALVKHIEARQQAALKAGARRDARRPKEIFPERA